jgi:hypothetical protein
VLDRGLPFHKTTLDELKYERPFTFMVNPELPAGTKSGYSDSMTGAGFGEAETTVKGRAVELPPPGLGVTTLTDAEPTVDTSAAVT